MPKLPVISGRQARRAFEKAGWIFNHQRGSHMVLVRAGIPINLTVPDHRELDRGLLRGLIRDAGLTVEEFVALLD
ncbi:MAG: type II toxin-antitoxin system HicA family toxin [Planctomycetota bacterium]|nr:type II toxin-antitoxin system HicA family toxin [Planctomycetota bacterium]